MRTTSTLACLLMATALATPPAFAQQSTETTPQRSASQSQCYDELGAFSQRMNEEGFWVTGWGNRYAQPGTPVAPVATAEERAIAPWAGIGADVASPRAQIRELYSAAQVLAYQGDIEGCQYLLSVLENTYQDYTAQLTEAGVEPDAISGWRQERIALAEPITEVERQGRVNFDDLAGTDVRNANDESLGSVSDLVLDPGSGQISHAMVARGGFLGIGEDYVAVPWERFYATPGLNTLVLNIDQDAFDEAPTVDPQAFADPGQLDQQNQQINDYWGSHDQS